MTINKLKDYPQISVVEADEIIIDDVQSALGLIATVSYETGNYKLIIDKKHITEAFFDLKTGLAGEVLQKFVNYSFRLAILGDFSVYTSKSLRDFIYESNNGSHIFFMPTVDGAIEKLLK